MGGIEDLKIMSAVALNRLRQLYRQTSSEPREFNSKTYIKRSSADSVTDLGYAKAPPRGYGIVFLAHPS